MFTKKNLRFILVLFAAATVLCSLLVGCSTASKLSFASDKFVVGVGKELTLDFTVTPKKADYSFSVSNDTIASVTRNGVVKGLKTGIVTVTLASGDKTATTTLVVSDSTNPADVNINGKKEYTVSFFLAYPFTFIQTEKYRENEFVSFALPSYVGYDVDGWYRDSDCTTKFDEKVEKITENLTLYCRRTAKENSFVVDGDGYICGLLYPSLAPEELVLPEIAEGKNVRGIANKAFYSYTTIKKAVIPASYESIGDFAFAGCVSLTEVEIEKGSALKSIGKFAFGVTADETDDGKTVPNEENACKKLEKIELPDSVEQIGAFAFGYCEKLSVNVPSSLTVIDYGTFYKTQIAVANLKNVTEVKAYAFGECNKLATVINAQNVEYCGKNSFFKTAIYSSQINASPYVVYVDTIVYGCNEGLGKTFVGNGKVNLKETATLIADGAFSGKNQSELSVYFNGANVKIGEDAFIDGNGVCLVVPDETLEKYKTDNPAYKNLFCTKFVVTINDDENAVNFGEHTLLRFGANDYRYDKYTVLTSPTDPSKKKTPLIIDLTALQHGGEITRINTRAINHYIGKDRNKRFTGRMQTLILPENLRSIAVFAVLNCGELQRIDMTKCRFSVGLEQNSFQFSTLGENLPKGETTYVYVKQADYDYYYENWKDKGLIKERLKAE